MAATGHAGTQAPQSMHSSGWMYSIGACSNSGSSLRGWMQSTGQTSTQAVSFVPMQGSVMMKAIALSLHKTSGQFQVDVRMNRHDKVQGGLTDAEKRANVLRLAFGGDQERFDEFCRMIREEIPEGTGVVLRGSAVTGQRWKDGAPFDAEGPGTSDLDLTLVGDEAVALFKPTGFFVPGVHSRPVSDEDPGHRAVLDSAARDADGDDRPTRQHPGVARRRHPVPGRTARPAVSHVDREGG